MKTAFIYSYNTFHLNASSSKCFNIKLVLENRGKWTRNQKGHKNTSQKQENYILNMLKYVQIHMEKLERGGIFYKNHYTLKTKACLKISNELL